MFKLVVLSALLAVSAASVLPYGALTKTVHFAPKPIVTGYAETILKPNLEIPVVKTAIIAEPSHVEVRESAIAKVGEYVESVPTAVSHQSSTIVHSRANVVTPVVAPIVKTYSAPIVRSYAAPLPVALPAPAPVPIISSYAAAGPILRSYPAALPVPVPSPIISSYAAAGPALRLADSTIQYAGAPGPFVSGYASGSAIRYASPSLQYDAGPAVRYVAPSYGGYPAVQSW